MTLLELLEPHYGANPAEVSYLEGFLRYHGLGLPQDFTAAFHHIESAANANLPAAQYLAGRMLIEGRGVAQDADAGLALLRSASDQSFIPAILFLVILISQANPNSEEVFTLNEVAAKRGVPSAAHALAVAYEEGLGVAKNEQKALQWYEKAASLRDSFSAQRLSLAYREGQLGLQINSNLAHKWAETAEEQRFQLEKDEFECVRTAGENGHRASQILLAMIFEKGLYGARIDLTQSKYWEQRSKE